MARIFLCFFAEQKAFQAGPDEFLANICNCRSQFLLTWQQVQKDLHRCFKILNLHMLYIFSYLLIFLLTLNGSNK